jgi:hypothetical protein
VGAFDASFLMTVPEGAVAFMREPFLPSLALRKQMKSMPSRDPSEPAYRRLRYCGYADDWLLGFTGPRQEAEEIKEQIGTFLRDQLALEVSPPRP